MKFRWMGAISGAIMGFFVGFVLQGLVNAAGVSAISGIASAYILPVTFLAGFAAGAVGLFGEK
ncbi:MAG: hypothetical protein AB1467_06875 [Candidatus Diapherotrites archaeon]